MSYMQSLLMSGVLLDDMLVVRTKKRVLVVDDDAMVRDLLCKMLTAVGLKAVPAENGREAYELFQHGLFDLVVTDLQMPVMDGWTLIKKLRRHSHALPVLVITGQPPEEVIPISGEIPGCIVLHKPFNLKDLTQSVIEALDMSHYGSSRMPRSKRRPLHSMARP